MATVETEQVTTDTPKLKIIKKVFATGGRKSLDGDLTSLRGGIRGSVDSLAADKSADGRSGDSSPSHDESNRSGSTSAGIKKLIPGHAKRKRRKLREEELRIAAEEVARGRPYESSEAPPSALTNQSTSSLTHEDGSSLLTDEESESEQTAPAPPLVSRESHAPYLTLSSPLIVTTAIDENGVEGQAQPVVGQTSHRATVPVSANVSPSSKPLSGSTPVLPMPSLVDKADTLRPDLDSYSLRRKSISKRGISPARKIKEVFTRPGKSPRPSPRSSPERGLTEGAFGDSVNSLTSNTGSLKDRRFSQASGRPDVPPVDSRVDTDRARAYHASLPSLDVNPPPRTPPSATLTTPVTTVTPPTPTDGEYADGRGSPRRHTEAQLTSDDLSRAVASPLGNVTTHRRARSTSAAQPSKLSNSTLPPLTPTIEETIPPADRVLAARNLTPSGGFFSSWVSAASKAAADLTSTINLPNARNRSATTTSEPKPVSEEIVNPEGPAEEPEEPRKQMAIETLGAGELNFGHLGIDSSQEEKISPMRPELEELRRNTTVRRDEAAAKIEDMLAKRAVSAAYESGNDQTPMVEIPDPMSGIRSSQTFGSTLKGDKTPPNDSIFEGETTSVKRSNSVRSKIANRRSRGSSIATGHSTIGAALVGASTATLANPASGPKLPGFAVAPKQRNRTFHQLFRSVPEDDYLIEDYSCALQRDILLAGRIYISEGHICFSSNILGWVTTLVISFEEVVSIEKENTAMVFPNAIAIQTLHARHTFRSLLSREATFDLMIGIWKVSHPAAFKKSTNGKQELEEAASSNIDPPAVDGDQELESDEEDEEEDDDDDDEEDATSIAGSGISLVASEGVADGKSVVRKPSGMNGSVLGVSGTSPPPGNGDLVLVEKTPVVVGDVAHDFPGPAAHAPTDCTDSATHYEKIIKDEIIPAPLGKIYDLVYGASSLAFVKKYLTEEQKVTDLTFDDNKTGLTNDTRSRQYTYIKPLSGPIGPKQTKCITTENLDFFDLDKSVSVTCTTQTPDVPSGNAFSVKTRYCLSWAPGNATRLQMNCGIEWTAKSWLKGPIEKGANDGQQSYGDGLVKVLKAGLPRPRAATAGSKGKPGKKKRKGEKGVKAKEVDAATIKLNESWGVLEPLHSTLGPVVDVVRPMTGGYGRYAIIGVLLCLLLFSRTSLRGSTSRDVGLAGLTQPERAFAYEELWRREESELWEWLDERVGIDGIIHSTHKSIRKKKTPPLVARNINAKLNEEKMSQREMEDAIRVTQERLSVLHDVVHRRKKSGDKEEKAENYGRHDCF